MIDPLILLRWVHFAATALAAGAVLFLVVIAEPTFRAAHAGAEGPAFRRSGCWLVWSGLIVAVISGAGWLVWLAADIYGTSMLSVCLHGGAWSVLTETRFGIVWLVRLGLALALAVLVQWPAGRLLQLAAAAGLTGSLACIGHAGASADGSGQTQLVFDILHLLAAGAWIGSLPALALLLHRAWRAGNSAWGAVAADAARRYSTVGVLAVGMLLATGILNSWYLLAGPRDLVATGYGRLILLKILLFAAMIGVAAVNRFRLTPRLPFPAATRALEKNCLAEIALGLFVFLSVGALGTLPPTGHSHIPAVKLTADAAYVHIHSSEAMADVTIEPGRVGTARARIFLMHEDFSVLTAKDVTFMLTPQRASDAPAISRVARRLPDGAWRVDDLPIGAPGTWTVKLLIDAGAPTPIVLDAPVAIDR